MNPHITIETFEPKIIQLFNSKLKTSANWIPITVTIGPPAHLWEPGTSQGSHEERDSDLEPLIFYPLELNGCFNLMMNKNLYMGNGCFTKPTSIQKNWFPGQDPNLPTRCQFVNRTGQTFVPLAGLGLEPRITVKMGEQRRKNHRNPSQMPHTQEIKPYYWYINLHDLNKALGGYLQILMKHWALQNCTCISFISSRDAMRRKTSNCKLRLQRRKLGRQWTDKDSA